MFSTLSDSATGARCRGTPAPPRKCTSTLLAILLAGSGLCSAESISNNVNRPALAAEVYHRAERFLPWNAEFSVPNLDIKYHWISDSAFWYILESSTGKELLLVDVSKGVRRTSLNLTGLARGLSDALGRLVDMQSLPLKSIEKLNANGNVIELSIEGKSWRCEVKLSHCEAVDDKPRGGVVSPDGRWLAFLKGDDIWLRSTRDNSERPLTTDGQAHYAYGRIAGTAATIGLHPDAQNVPLVLWSPNSKKLLVERLDERHVGDLFLVEEVPSEGVRPILHSYRYAFPGDSNKPSAELSIIAISGQQTPIQHAPFPATFVGPIADDRAWWSLDGRSVFVIPREEGQQRVQLLKVDADTGVTRPLIEERGNTFVEIGGEVLRRDVRDLSDGRIIWYSERSDWGHLYLYDKEGKLLHPLTAGAWKVMDIVRVDERRGEVFFTAVGREAMEDPYQRQLYVVNLDGTGLRLLTPENADHDIHFAQSALIEELNGATRQESFSSAGSYFIDTYSRPDLPPSSVLRSQSGQFIAKLSQADVSRLQLAGLTLPQPFHVLAADGHTLIYGTIYRPSDFSAHKRYPVIDVIYPGPQATMTPKTFKGALFADFENSQTLAELGFVVVNIDGRGTPFRSKSFLNNSYGDLANAGNLDDHMAAIRQLASEYPYMDLEHVGITGASGGGFASARAILAHPEFYKVAVAISGSHDWRSYILAWLPTYQGADDGTHYESVLNARLAKNLTGKLLLIHGDMDDNVPVAQTMQLVDALIKADKDFDMLILPGEHHSLKAAWGYVERRRWDYFVRNLMGVEPPANFTINQDRR